MIGKLGVIHLRIYELTSQRWGILHLIYLWHENRYPLVIQLWKIAMFNMVNLQWAFFHSYVKLPKDSNPKQMPKSWKTGKYESTSSKSWENVSIFLWTRICLIYWTCWFTSQRYRIPTDTVYICIPFVSLFSAETWQSNTMFQCFRLLDRARKRETSMGKTRSFQDQILGCWCLFYQPNTWGCLKFGNPKSPSCGSVIIMFPMKKALDWGCTILR